MQLPLLNRSESKSGEGLLQSNDLFLPQLSSRSSKMPSKKRRWLRWLVGILLLSICLLLALTVFHRPLLIWTGNTLVFESELKPCEIAVVLTGGGTIRLERAIDLLETGKARKILMTLPNPIPEGTAYYDLFNTEKTMCQALLDYHKIPPEKVAWSETPFHSTYEEAVFLRGWMEQNQCKSAIVVAGYFQSKRAKWTVDRVFRGSAFDVRIAAASEEFCTANDWWQTEEGIIRVENEFLKNAYYRLKGLVGTP